MSRTKTVNLWVTGTGLIGSTLLKQLSEQHASLRENLGIDLQLRGIGNSRQMCLFTTDNLTEGMNSSIPADAPPFDASAFVAHIKSANLPHSIFVDCTASDSIPSYYPELLRSSVSVVTPNKRGFSGSLELYRRLQSAASFRRVPLLHETCVGAALPILGTLSDLVRSGDRIISIEAVLSGTLSFIWNAMASGVPFSEAVLEAKSRGYTEPDPRDDLSGMDVARKVLILARDAGLSLELEDVAITPMLPAETQDWSLDEFMSKLTTLDSYFNAKLEEAANQSQRLFFSAHIDCANREASIGVRAVGSEHPFCALKGADNIVAFQTVRYAEQPLVIKGPGAGAEVTAAGVFADIIRIAR